MVGGRQIWKLYLSVRCITEVERTTRPMCRVTRLNELSKIGTEPKRNFMNELKPKSKNYVVENNIPVNPIVRSSIYPFGEMAVNQSVEIPNKRYATIIGSLRKHKAAGKKYSCRKTETGFRVWRLK